MSNIYALVNPSNNIVVNTIVYDGVAPLTFAGNTLVNLTGITPRPTQPGFLPVPPLSGVEQPSIPFHWQYTGTNFQYVTGS